jgi:serine/threonine protein kinase
MSSTSGNTFAVGTVLGEKWVVLELLGKGGMGEVYRVHQLNLKRDVAVKVISTKFLEEIHDNEYETETFLERFNREVQVMARVHHPNVLQIYDCGSISVKGNGEEVPVEYIAMEYIPGGTLRSTMSSEGFYPEEDRMKEWMTTYFMPLLDGVKSLHDSGIVHRDLKPENVLLDGNIPKIADFGLARSYHSKPVTQSMDMRGTPPYMSPEHFLDLKRTDGRTDVYALGKILYEAASGKMGSDQIPFKQARLKDPETPFYKSLDRVIQEATAEDKNERLASVDSLREALEGALAETAKLPPISVEGDHARGNTLKAWAMISALVVLFSLITAFGVMYFHKRGFVPPSSSGQPSLLGPTGQETSNKQGVASLSGKEAVSTPAVLQGKDDETLHLIPGGTVTLPDTIDAAGGKTVKVDSFYLDDTEVTNQQYVHFLNRVLSRIKVKNGVMEGDDGKVWLLLGEVMEGYKPIVYKDGKFSVREADHAACPVLRVTAYGARAYANFFGERLMTDVEWLRALEGGGAAINTAPQSDSRSTQESETSTMGSMMGTPPRSQPQESAANLPIPAPVILFKPNNFGIRGLNGRIGEWGIQTINLALGDNKGNTQYVVLGGALNNPRGESNVPSAVPRYPWEAHPTVGFRCALSIPSSGR